MKTTIRTAVGRALIAAGATTAISASAWVGTASASPTTDGCPSGFAGHTIDYWIQHGYPNAPRNIDSAGNGDGTVCGRELGQGTSKQTVSGQVLYEFADNNLPAPH